MHHSCARVRARVRARVCARVRPNTVPHLEQAGYRAGKTLYGLPYVWRLAPSDNKICPDLAQLDLEDNYLTDDGCTALALAIAHGHLVAHELWLAGNPAITPGKRGAMKSELGSPGAPYKSIVSFTPSATGSPFHEDGTISDRTGGRI